LPLLIIYVWLVDAMHRLLSNHNYPSKIFQNSAALKKRGYKWLQLYISKKNDLGFYT